MFVVFLNFKLFTSSPFPYFHLDWYNHHKGHQARRSSLRAAVVLSSILPLTVADLAAEPARRWAKPRALGGVGKGCQHPGGHLVSVWYGIISCIQVCRLWVSYLHDWFPDISEDDLCENNNFVFLPPFTRN